MKALNPSSLRHRSRPGALCGQLFSYLTALVVLASLSFGCRAIPNRDAHEVATPNPAPAVLNKTPGGALVVYTALDGFDTIDPQHDHHTPYKIFAADGHLLHKINNQTGSFGSDPLTVHLPPGLYKIEGRALNLGPITLSVKIEDGRMTVVHLDGTGLAKPEAGIVMLPNGDSTGWKAQR